MALTADTQLASPPPYRAVVLVRADTWLALHRCLRTSGLTTTRIAARGSVPRFELATAPDHDLQGLSRREVEVIELMAEGLENTEIAKELGVSVDTVKTHSKHIYRKFEAKSRAHAVHIAYQRGILGGA